jgi:broad specificity phosphatase PhoE
VEFVLVRHGQPEWVRDGFNVADPPLTERGQRQASLMAEALAAEPFDEVACQALMHAHATAGNRAEALRVYADCRKLFREELGADPSEQTAAVFLRVLRGPARCGRH